MSRLLAARAELPVKDRWLLERQERMREEARAEAASVSPPPRAQHSEAAAAGRKGSTVTAPSLSPSGAMAAVASTSDALVPVTSELVPVGPPGAARAKLRSRTGRDCGVEETEGDTAATHESLPRQREAVLLAAMDAANQKAREEEKTRRAATTMQAAARMFLARRRFRRHTTAVKDEIARIVAQRNMRCAIAVQRCVRGLVCRLKYRRQREEEAMAALEASKLKSKAGRGKGGGGGGKGGGNAAGKSTNGLNAILSPQDLALQQNAAFIAGVRKLLANSLDEALAQFETQQRLKPEPITAAMVELVRRKRDGVPAAASPGPGSKDAPPPKGKPAAKKAGKK